MKFMKGFKIRMLPTKEQEKFLFDITDGCRYTWNWCLSRQIKEYEINKKKLKFGELFQAFKQHKYTKEWLMRLPHRYMNQVIRDLEKAYSYFFKYIKTNNHGGFPHFKKKKTCIPSFNGEANTYFVYKNGVLYVNIAKLGLVKVQVNYKELYSMLFQRTRKEQLNLIANPRIIYKHGIWTVNFVLECENQAPKLTDNLMGIDLGTRTLAVVKYGDKFYHYNNINKMSYMKRLKARLIRTQRKISKAYKINGKRNHHQRYKRTTGINKLRKHEKRLYEKMHNIRMDYIHKTTRTLIEMLPKRICLEDLKVNNLLKSRRNAEEIQEAMWRQFRRQIEYKAQRYGIEVIFANTFYPSSKTCSCCGNINRNLGSKTIYKCNICGLVIDRDENAASNLQMYKL